MNQKYEFHLHTSYCDGKHTPEETVKAAVERGFEILGFSGHGHTDFDSSFCMSKIRTDSYCDDISALKEKYADRIQILCGIEQDYYSSDPTTRFDYVIGSVHYLYLDGRYMPVDMAASDMQNILNTYYGGDFSALAEDYFATVADVVNKTECDIIGHFDLITKFQNKIELKKDKRYYDAAFAAVSKLIPYGVPFEINLGAIARGYRNSPYPSKEILKEIRRLGGEIIITGDCHDASKLGDNYEVAASLAKECGFAKRVILTKDGKDYARI